MTPLQPFRLGLLVNPYAGIGGPAGLKGSDDADVAALTGGGNWTLTAPARAQTFVNALMQESLPLQWVTVAGAMGQNYLKALAQSEQPAQSAQSVQPVEILPLSLGTPTSAEDTTKAVQALGKCNLDLIVFAGGDGTARDVLNGLPKGLPALGIPAGVKMHSGVYAITPQDAATVVTQMIRGELVKISEQEVRDIDEQAFRQGTVKSCYYGEISTPESPQFVQHVKQGGFEVEELVLLDIAEHLTEQLPDSALCIVGPGSTTWHVLKNWGLEGTLLGVDLVLDGELIAADADAQTIQRALDDHTGPVRIIVTAIGGQGHIIGRGNQQISAQIIQQVLDRAGPEGLCVIATRTKLKSLAGRPLLVDSGEYSLDQKLAGFTPVITGFADSVLYRVGYPPASVDHE